MSYNMQTHNTRKLVLKVITVIVTKSRWNRLGQVEVEKEGKFHKA